MNQSRNKCIHMLLKMYTYAAVTNTYNDITIKYFIFRLQNNIGRFFVHIGTSDFWTSKAIFDSLLIDTEESSFIRYWTNVSYLPTICLLTLVFHFTFLCVIKITAVTNYEGDTAKKLSVTL